MITLIFFTSLFAGLIAGLLYAYSCAVNPGLHKLTDAEYVKAMQAINTAIQNPLFFLPFMGLLILFPLSAYQLYQYSSSPSGLFIAAMIIYFVAVFGVTVFCNVPLNEQLAKLSVQTATEKDIAEMRKIFEKPWNRFHTIRTIASLISFGLAVYSLLKLKN